MKRCMLFLLLVIILFNLALASGDVESLHKVNPPVHQWIAYQAGEIWSTNEIEGYLSTNYESCDPINGNKNDIIEGTCEEDDEYTGCSLLNPSRCCSNDNCEYGSYFKHFWDPDAPNGGNYNKGLDFPSQYDSSYTIAQFYWSNYVIPYYDSNKSKSYYYLGRVVHLLEDATVPAHVHLDQHATNDDSYEDFMPSKKDNKSIWGEQNKRNFEHFNGEDYIDKFYRQESLYWDDNVKSNASGLFKLFWFTAQKTEYYASDNWDATTNDGVSGTYIDNYYSHENGDLYYFPGGEHNQYLWEEEITNEGVEIIYDKDDLVDDDDGDWGTDLKKIAEANIPHAMKAVAGLYRLFWIETHNLAPCESGSCCDTNLDITKGNGEQPDGFGDYNFCQDEETISHRNYSCSGTSATESFTDSHVETCNEVSICGNATCNRIPNFHHLKLGNETTVNINGTEYDLRFGSLNTIGNHCKLRVNLNGSMVDMMTLKSNESNQSLKEPLLFNTTLCDTDNRILEFFLYYSPIPKIINFSISPSLNFGTVRPGRNSSVVNSTITVGSNTNTNFSIDISLINDTALFQNIHFDLNNNSLFENNEKLNQTLLYQIENKNVTQIIDLQSILTVPKGTMPGQTSEKISYTVTGQV